MIVPSSRLLWLVGLTALPAAAIGGLVPGTAGWSIGVIAIAGAVALADALAAPRRLRGIRVTLPALVRCSRNKEFAIPITLHNGGVPAILPRIGSVAAIPGSVKEPLPEAYPDHDKAHPVV